MAGKQYGFEVLVVLLVKTELERRMKFADLQCEWAQVLRGLEALQQNSAHLHARAQSCGAAPEMIKYKNVVTFSYSLVH